MALAGSIIGAALAIMPGAAPSLMFTSPSDRSTVAGSVELTVDAEGVNAGGIEFLVDGTSVAVDRTAPYSHRWDTRDVPNGSHEVTASAANVDGPAMATVRATVANEVVLAVGDSLNVQAYSEGPLVGMPPGFQQVSAGGAQAFNLLAPVTLTAQLGQLKALVVMLGVNDTNDGGWTREDVVRFRTMITSPGPGACVTIVLPAVTDAAGDQFPLLAQELPATRAGLAALAAERPGTVVLDSWQQAIDADPSIIGADGVHLSQDARGAYTHHARRTRQEVVHQALATCPD